MVFNRKFLVLKNSIVTTFLSLHKKEIYAEMNGDTYISSELIADLSVIFSGLTVKKTQEELAEYSILNKLKDDIYFCVDIDTLKQNEVFNVFEFNFGEVSVNCKPDTLKHFLKTFFENGIYLKAEHLTGCSDFDDSSYLLDIGYHIDMVPTEKFYDKYVKNGRLVCSDTEEFAREFIEFMDSHTLCEGAKVKHLTASKADETRAILNGVFC